VECDREQIRERREGGQGGRIRERTEWKERRKRERTERKGRRRREGEKSQELGRILGDLEF
jgi:hypothetical protein